MTSANTTRLASSRFGREALLLVTNLMNCLLAFSLVWLPLHLPSDLPGEVLDHFAITCVYYLPVFFLLLYVPVRALTARGTVGLLKRRFYLHAFTWLIGVPLGILLAVADTYTRLFWTLNPVLKVLGV